MRCAVLLEEKAIQAKLGGNRSTLFFLKLPRNFAHYAELGGSSELGGAFGFMRCAVVLVMPHWDKLKKPFPFFQLRFQYFYFMDFFHNRFRLLLSLLPSHVGSSHREISRFVFMALAWHFGAARFSISFLRRCQRDCTILFLLIQFWWTGGYWPSIL